MEELRVSDLMSSDPRQWDIGLLHELFNDRDVKAILQIPLQETNCSDSWVWHYSKTGKYTVKSGYWVGLETSFLSEENGMAGEWGKIWNLQVPPKVKHFLWRATRNCLPVRASLQRKGIQVPLTCVQCGGDIENNWHIFLTCPVAQSCWSETQFMSSINSCSSQVESFVEFIFMMLNSRTTEEMGKVVMILWSLWRQRNEKLWNNQQNTPSQVVHFALQNLYDWLQAKEKKKALHPNSNSVDTSCKRWHKPPASFLKCNTDAALFTSSNRFGLSGVLRDENGEFIACRMQHNAGNPAVKECEALALLQAITWIKEMELENVIFELDAKNVVDAIRNPIDDDTEFGSIVCQCKSLLNQGTSLSVQFVYRQANVAAHALARAAHLYASPSTYFEIPQCLIEHLDDGCNSLHA